MLMQFNALRLTTQYPKFNNIYHLLELYDVIVTPTLSDFQSASEIAKTFGVETRCI